MPEFWIIKFEQDYLRKHTLPESHPQELVDIDAMSAHCDVKEHWK